MRLAVSFGVSSFAVYILGPTVKTTGFTTLLLLMAAIAACTTLFVALLPDRVPVDSRPLLRLNREAFRLGLEAVRQRVRGALRVSLGSPPRTR